MKKFSYKQFLIELEKEIVYVQGEILKDYSRDINYYHDIISQGIEDIETSKTVTKNIRTLIVGITGMEEDKEFTLGFFKHPEAKEFVNYELNNNQSIDLLFVMAMIKRFVDDAICFNTLNVDYWMVEDDKFFGKVIRRSFVKKEKKKHKCC